MVLFGDDILKIIFLFTKTYNITIILTSIWLQPLLNRDFGWDTMPQKKTIVK